MSNASNPPPGVPPQEPQWHRPAPPPREGRSASFFVAIFLGILLLVSAGLNLLLLLVSVGSVASAGFGGAGAGEDDGLGYELVRTGGDAKAERKVLRIPITGAIAEGANPVLGAGGGTVTQVRRALHVAKDDDQVRGILLEIDSPGGGVTDSDEIYRMLMQFRAEHPKVKVVALFGDIAASGGYYIAAAAQRIVARRTSMTGSIGVIMSSWNFAEAAKKLGVDQIAIKSQHTPFKDILSPTRPMTDAEKAMLTSIVEDYYQQFVDVVDKGRDQLDHDQVQKLASGAVYSAKQALENGLIDAIGGADEVERWFRDELGGPVQLIEHRRRPSLRDVLFGARATPAPTLAEAAGRLLTASTGPRFLYYWEGAR